MWSSSVVTGMVNVAFRDLRNRDIALMHKAVMGRSRVRLEYLCMRSHGGFDWVVVTNTLLVLPSFPYEVPFVILEAILQKVEEASMDQITRLCV